MKHLRRGPWATAEAKVSVEGSGSRPENRCVTTIISDDDDDNHKTVIKMSRQFDFIFDKYISCDVPVKKYYGSLSSPPPPPRTTANSHNASKPLLTLNNNNNMSNGLIAIDNNNDKLSLQYIICIVPLCIIRNHKYSQCQESTRGSRRRSSWCLVNGDNINI